jgi:predicted dehydrogenase
MTVVAGCFGLAMNGTHYIEAFRYLTDDKPARVQAWFAPDDLANPRGPDFKDKAGSIRIETSSGKRLYIEASNDHGHGMTFTIATPYGHIIADELAGEMITTNRNAEHRGLPATRYGMPNQRNKMEIPVADNVKPTAAVLKALLDGENYPTGQQARQALAALVAAYVSNDNGNRAIYVDGELPEDTIFPWA